MAPALFIDYRCIEHYALHLLGSRLAGDNESNVPPEGESGKQMKERVLAAFSEIQEDTCIITHGGVIATIMEHLFPEENKNRYQWQPKPGHGYVICEGTYTILSPKYE